MNKNFWWYALGGVLVGLVILGFVLDKSKNVSRTTQTQNSTNKSTVAKPVQSRPVDKTLDFLDGRGEPVWLVTTADVEQPAFAKLESVAANYMVRIESALTTYQGDPQVKKLKDRFSKNFSPSYYTRKYGGTSLRSSRNEAELRDGMNKLEVCFYSNEYKTDPRMKGATVHYDQEWGALILPAMHISDPWFAGIILHEMYHAYAHQTNQAGATAPHLSDSWIEEELTAHDIERGVLDKATKGEYLKLVTKLAKKHNDVNDANALLSTITTADLQEIDKIFPPADSMIANLRAAQYYFDIATVWFGLRLSGDELRKQRIIYYRSQSS